MTRAAILAALLTLTGCSTPDEVQGSMFKACVENINNTPADCAKAVKEVRR